MSFRAALLALHLLPLLLAGARAATHDEVGRCGLTGIYKMRQSVLESPNYPDPYPTNACWDYVVRSPYRCPTKFHIQFLDFFLEASANCSNDYLAVGLENDGDDMDLLCGQVVGIKKYHTPDGVLRLRFRSDDSPWTTGTGFKLLVTRLACEREDLAQADFRAVDDESAVAPPLELRPPLSNGTVQRFRNTSHSFSFPPSPSLPYDSHARNPPGQLFPWHGPPLGPSPYLAQWPVPPTHRPAIQVQRLDVPPAGEPKPCRTESVTGPGADTALHESADQFEAFNDNRRQRPFATQPWPQRRPQSGHPEPAQFEIDSSASAALTPCCASSFREGRFYLSSPGFPRTAFSALLPASRRDCRFQVAKASPSVCRLRVEFRYFDFGHAFRGTGDAAGRGNVPAGVVETTRDACTGDYVEIEGQRFCGCRSGHVFTALWRGEGEKSVRLRIGNSGVPSNGFLLDVVQEECRAQYLGQEEEPGGGGQGSGHQQQPQQQQQPQEQQQPPPNGFGFFGQPVPASFVPGDQQQLYQIPASQQQQQLLVYPQQQLWARPEVPYVPTHFRRARRFHEEPVVGGSSHQPVTVVETNSTRKEYYYFDADGYSNPNHDNDGSEDHDDGDVDGFADFRPTHSDVAQDRQDNRQNSKYVATAPHRCHFDTADVLRLSVDPLWITKPICYAPAASPSSWSNVFG